MKFFYYFIFIFFYGCSIQPSIPINNNNVSTFLTEEGYVKSIHKEYVSYKHSSKIQKQWDEMFLSTINYAEQNEFNYFGFINNESVDFRYGFAANTYSSLNEYISSQRDGRSLPFFENDHYCFKLLFFKEKPKGYFVFDVKNLKKEILNKDKNRDLIILKNSYLSKP